MNTKALGSKVFEDRSSLRQLMSTNNPHFNQRMKQIVTKNFEEIKQAGVFEKRNEPTSNLFYFRANLYSSGQNQELQDFMLQQVEHFYSNFQGTFALVYVHASFFDFLAFRKMIQKWPEHFFYRLRRIYILTPSVMVKFIQTFSLGSFYRLCDQLFYNVDSQEDLRVHDEEILKSLGEAKTPTKNTFNSTIKIIQSSIYGKKIDQYDLMFGRYPQVLLQLLSRILRNTNQLKTQGIFRKSCDSEELQRLQKQIEIKEKQVIWNQPDILVVCGCLKKILNNLRYPLFNYIIYQKVIDFHVGDQSTFIKSIFSQMEYVNHKVFVLLTIFLVDYIVAQQQQNKMSGYNLAVVFGPCFFRPKEYDLKDLIYSGKFAKILVTAFDNYKQMIDESQIVLARGTLQELRKNPVKL